jgi:hypothetical protein
MASEGQDPAALLERLELIERMVEEGRRVTEHWGWAFVLWGTGHLVALTWSAFWHGNSSLPWNVTMVGCGLIMVAGVAVRRHRQGVRSALSRSVGAIWSGFAASLLMLVAVSPSGLIDRRLFVGLIFMLLGSANMASGIALRWRAQMAVGVVWWAASLVQVYAPAIVSVWFFAGTALVCEVGFGAWLMARERREGARA